MTPESWTQLSGVFRVGPARPRRSRVVRSTQFACQGQTREKCAKLFSMSPTEEYSQRLAEREARLAHYDVLDARIEKIRLTIGASFLIVAWLCFGPISIPHWWLVA